MDKDRRKGRRYGRGEERDGRVGDTWRTPVRGYISRHTWGCFYAKLDQIAEVKFIGVGVRAASFRVNSICDCGIDVLCGSGDCTGRGGRQ